MNKTSQPHRIRCAWCGRDLGPAPLGCWADTDGICEDCDERLREEAGLQESE